MAADEPVRTPLLAELLPYLLVTALAAAALTLGVLKVSGALAPSGAHATGPAVVTFDVVKYTNATRAVASSFLKKGTDTDVDASDAGTLLLGLPERTRATIARVAGPGTLVMVKQGVVQGQGADITDQVLKELGLPLNVPTQDAAAYALDAAPTMLKMVPQPTARRPTPMPASGTQLLP